MLVFLKKYLNYVKDKIFRRFLRKYDKLLFSEKKKKLLIRYNDAKLKA